jgi:hypothetical protein
MVLVHGDNHTVGFVLIENRMDRSNQIEPIFVNQRVAR